MILNHYFSHNLLPLNFLLVWEAINPEVLTLPNLILTTVLMSSNNFNSCLLEAEAELYSSVIEAHKCLASSHKALFLFFLLVAD